MTTPVSAESHHIARQLLAHERRAIDPGAEDRSPAHRILEKLRAPLAMLAGEGGAQALLSRALSLARREVNWLATVRVASSGALEGLREGRPENEHERERGETIVVARLLELLITFVGRTLTLRILADVWPEGAFGE